MTKVARSARQRRSAWIPWAFVGGFAIVIAANATLTIAALETWPGLATDDAHGYHAYGVGKVNPGRGWVMVRSPYLSAEAVVRGLEAGDFYASTGVVLSDYRVSTTSMSVTIAKTTFSKYRIQFIGRGGRLLKEESASPATYTFTGDEGYVRAKILESNGQTAWCQPVTIPGRR